MTFVNASLHTLFTGHTPKLRHLHRGREYFRFQNGQIRRQIGQGHSRAERLARRQARHILRSTVHCGTTMSVYFIAAHIVAQPYQSAPAAT